VIDTHEHERQEYFLNGPDRCYWCKNELYEQLLRRLPAWGVQTIVNGANCDDLGDYRPGMKSARERGVRSPLIDCNVSKAEVRILARVWGLRVWDKPASPCLASRIAYGQRVTPGRLQMIDAAEECIRRLGIAVVRVRYLPGAFASIEVPAGAIEFLQEPKRWAEIDNCLKDLGFAQVVIDLNGYRAGNLNAMIIRSPDI
jgi:uncharacterized protein